MHAAADEMAVELEVGDIHTKGEDWGGQVVRHLRPARRHRLHARCSRASPATCASAPHWGYVIDGSIHVRYADGTEEVSRAGDLYHWPGGHTGWTDEGVIFIEFSPADGPAARARAPRRAARGDDLSVAPVWRSPVPG